MRRNIGGGGKVQRVDVGSIVGLSGGFKDYDQSLGLGMIRVWVDIGS